MRILRPIVCSQALVQEFITTANGYRLATSNGGVLTGRGADIILIDDPSANLLSRSARIYFRQSAGAPIAQAQGCACPALSGSRMLSPFRC